MINITIYLFSNILKDSNGNTDYLQLFSTIPAIKTIFSFLFDFLGLEMQLKFHISTFNDR